MNAVAQVLLNQGLVVTGSDRYLDQDNRLPILDKLEGLGIKLVPQDGSGLDEQTAGVVISTAIEADNPDRARATELNVPVVHRAAALAGAAQASAKTISKPDGVNHGLIAVAGTAGKSTTTGMLAWLLSEAGFAPNAVNGAGLSGWITGDQPGNVTHSSNNLWVVEADESDRSFLVFDPEYAIVLNIEKDHFEYDESVALFRSFAAKVKTAIFCGPNVKSLLQGSTDAELIEAHGEWPVNLPGAHNQENARLACLLACHLGIDEHVVREKIASFNGIERRLERVSSLDAAIQVFDDYAHNPGKIAAAIKTFQTISGNIHAIWRPHGFGPLANNADEFRAVFKSGCRPNTKDHVYILPVYYVGGTAGGTLSAEQFAKQLSDDDIPVSYCDDYLILEAKLRANLQPEDVVLVMGARDPHLPVFARKLTNPTKT